MSVGEDALAQQKPTLRRGVDMRRLPISPEEAFVLSRVDGESSGSDIALSTGLETDRVIDILLRLEHLGALAFDGRGGSDGARHRAAPGPAAAQPAAAQPAPASPAAAAEGARKPSAPPAAAAPVPDDGIAIPHDRRRVIDALYGQLGRFNQFEVLGVDRDADKQTIKKAYYDAVAIFHPDKYFRKNLGEYKQKLDKLLHRVTEAHDTLTRKKLRAKYESYLAARASTRAFEELSSDDARGAEVQRIRSQIEALARAASSSATPLSEPVQLADEAASQSPEAAPAPAASPRTEATARGGSIPPPPADGHPAAAQERPLQPRPGITEDVRRRLLARKLAAGQARPAGRTAGRPPPGPRVLSAADKELARQRVGEELRRRYNFRRRQLEQERIARLMLDGDECAAKGDFVSACNSFRVLVAMMPEDTDLRERLAEVEQKAATMLADKYLEQARYEEGNGQYPEAARAYEKAAYGKQQASLYEKASVCYAKSSETLKIACNMARKAVELSPSQIKYRITLATTYARAGMVQSSMKELERASELDPKNPEIKELMKRIERGEI